jgi:hypothetical protein
MDKSTGFCRLEVRIEDRPTFDAAGNISTEMAPHVGDVLYQWASPVRAYAWWKHARDLLNDSTLIDQLNSPVNTSDRNANRTQYIAQFHYIIEIIRSIADGYNCMNLVWHTDPVARALYRKWVSGPPLMSNDVSAPPVFEESADYNPRWYTSGYIYPTLSKDSALIQQNAFSSQGVGGAPGDSFAIGATLTLAAASTRGAGVPVEYAPAVYNVPMVRTAFMQTCTANVSGPWTRQCHPEYQATGLNRAPNTSDYTVFGASYLPGAQLPPGFDDWRAVYKGAAYGYDHVVAAPLVSYLPYLQEWVKTLLQRTAAQTIQDSRQYAIYCNTQLARLNGGPAAALQLVTRSSADILAQRVKTDAGWQLAATSVAAVGAALGPATGGIAAVVGGAVSAIISITDALRPHEVAGHGRDDLGRFKLLLERGWLSGDPASLDLDTGAPYFPPADAQAILTPPGTWVDTACPVPGSSSAGPGVVSALSGTSAWLPSWIAPAASWAAAGVVAGAVIAAVTNSRSTT